MPAFHQGREASTPKLLDSRANHSSTRKGDCPTGDHPGAVRPVVSFARRKSWIVIDETRATKCPASGHGLRCRPTTGREAAPPTAIIVTASMAGTASTARAARRPTSDKCATMAAIAASADTARVTGFTMAVQLGWTERQRQVDAAQSHPSKMQE